MDLEELENKGNIIIRGLCKNGTGSIHDMCFMNPDASYYPHMTPEKYIQVA